MANVTPECHVVTCPFLFIGKGFVAGAHRQNCPFFRLLLRLPGHPRVVNPKSEELVKTAKVMRNVVGSMGLVFAGYILVAALPDLWRYLKISTM